MEILTDSQKHFNKLAKQFVENLEWEKIPQIRATLHLGGLLVSTGAAAVSKDRVTFYPLVPKVLDAPLGSGASLKEASSGRVIPVRQQSQESFSVSSDWVWYFDR
jgi:hypothetical protein